MFVAIFDLHAQYPVLTPFAISLGAAPSFIGLIMGLYSATHIPGNILAGYGIDRFGSRIFIIWSLILAGVLLLVQAHVTSPWQLLVIRSISGFVLAFLSPACLALLAKLARDPVHQGKLMSGNGFVHTLASVVSPAAGAVLVASLGFSNVFTVLGWILIITGLLAWPGIKEASPSQANSPTAAKSKARGPRNSPISTPRAPQQLQSDQVIPWLFFLLPLAISFSQGILFFELPLSELSRDSILTSGLLFSIVSLGALATLSMLFINRYSSYMRTALGSLGLALVFFIMSVDWLVPISICLFLIGMAKGIIYPALATLLASLTSASYYGRIFALLSIAYSIGSFLGPIVSGNIRDQLSPYIIAFAALMLALAFLPFCRPQSTVFSGNSDLSHPASTFPGK